MKKILFSAIAVIVLASIAVLARTDYVNRINNMNKIANTVKLGNMLQDMCDVFRGEDVLASDPALSAGTTDTAKVKTAALKLWFDGSYKAFPSKETGFTATSHDIVAGKFATYRVSVKSDTTITLTKSASTYTTAAAAIAALASTPSNEISLGYVLVEAVGTFDASTTKLNSDSVAVTYVDETNYIMDLSQ